MESLPMSKVAFSPLPSVQAPKSRLLSMKVGELVTVSVIDCVLCLLIDTRSTASLELDTEELQALHIIRKAIEIFIISLVVAFGQLVALRTFLFNLFLKTNTDLNKKVPVSEPTLKKMNLP
jgi:ethanolamine transporter EutH